MLENKDDTHLRLRVLPSLGATKDKRIISKLIETASDVNQQSFVRSKALTSLERIKDDDVLDLLLKIKEDENEDKYRRASATRGLENYSEPEIYDILEKDARDTSKDEVVRRSAMKVLAASYDETKDYILELFIELLKDKDPKVVNGAVYYLGEIGDPRAIKPLQEVNKLLQLKTHKPGRITYSREDMSLESTLKQAFETIRRKEIDRRLK